MITSSDAAEVGSALKRTEPAKINGSWGIVIIRERIVSRGMRERSIESMVIVPESRSKMRRRTDRRDDLPLYCLDIV
jgi:hypothetical protein